MSKNTNYYIKDSNGNTYNFNNSRSLKAKIKDLVFWNECSFEVYVWTRAFGFILVPDHKLKTKAWVR